MKIKSIKIDGLFDLFDYDISFENEEHLLILTGANGFGKTTILNIIYAICNFDIEYLQGYFFDSCILKFEHIEISIKRHLEPHPNLIIGFTKKHGTLSNGREKAEISIIDIKWGIVRSEVNYNVFGFADKNEDVDMYAKQRKIWLTNEAIIKYISNHYYGINEILGGLNAHIIKEQRLIKKIDVYTEHLGTITEDEKSIIELAKDLKQRIDSILNKYSSISQFLDGSFPSRLLSKEASPIIKHEFESRFELVKAKQENLKKFSLSEVEQEIPHYNESDAKVLSVYLKDLEEKLKVFDSLLTKLDLFTTILNERRFTYKTIQIDRERGFYFKTINGKELTLDQLSSGEQHEVILLYELIFNATPDTIVLIDEPEISLHITWQKEFLNDLLKIIAMQNIQVIVATHAPAIINGRWDLVYTLEKATA